MTVLHGLAGSTVSTFTHQPHHFHHVFVSAAGEIDHDNLSRGQIQFFRLSNSVRTLERWDYALETTQLVERVECLRIVDACVRHPSLIVQPGVFGPDRKSTR